MLEGALRVAAKGAADGIRDERDAGQSGTEAVVQVPPDPPALLLAGGDRGLPGRLHLSRLPLGSDRLGEQRQG